MRVFTILAIVVSVAAGGGGCASNCTREMLGICTPRFQWKDSSEGCDCFLLDLAPPQATLWRHDGECTEDIADFFNTTVTEEDPAELFAWTTNFTIVDNTLMFESSQSCGGGRRADENATYAVSFNYGTSSNTFCGSGCERKLKLYTNLPDCQSTAPTSYDNDVATSWRGTSSGSNRWSGRSRRSNSASRSSGNDGTRRGGGSCNPLQNIIVDYNTTGSICQVGQCCGPNFCQREQPFGTCLALNENVGWRVGHICGDDTCVPVYPGTGLGQGGSDVTLGSSLDHAEGAIPEGGHLNIQAVDVANDATVAKFVAGNVAVAFTVNREYPDSSALHGYLPSGTYIIVTISSDALNGGDITVLRFDEDSQSFIDTLEDCAHDPPAVDVSITFADGVYSVPICHTSTFVVAASGDSKDKKDKHDKVSKKSKPAKKLATGGKAPKDVEKKAAKKGKAEIAIGVGVAGGAVILAGLGVMVRRRSNKNKKPVATAAPSTTEVAVVSV